MKVLIVDDEPLARARIARLLTKVRPDFELLPQAESAEQALDQVATTIPDLVLLDIEMPGLSGIELAKRLKQITPPPAIIFVTAYPDKALPAFAVAPQGYLVKPVDDTSLNQALAQLQSSHRAQQALKQQSAIVYSEHGVEKRILLSDIRVIRSEDKYLRVLTDSQSILIEGSLKNLLNKYSQSLLRVHRNTLINKGFIREIGHDSNKYWVEIHDFSDKVEVSRREWPKLKQVFEP